MALVVAPVTPTKSVTLLVEPDLESQASPDTTVKTQASYLSTASPISPRSAVRALKIAVSNAKPILEDADINELLKRSAHLGDFGGSTKATTLVTVDLGPYPRRADFF